MLTDDERLTVLILAISGDIAGAREYAALCEDSHFCEDVHEKEGAQDDD